MKFTPIFTLMLFTAIAQAAPLVGYSTLEPANQYQIKNADQETIFKATADTVKRVELRDGFAVVQSSTNNVSLIHESGKVLVDSVYGSELKVSKKLLAIYNKDGIGAVYTLKGTQLFPASDDSATRPVKDILISNDRYAFIDRITRILSVHDLSGAEIATFGNVKSVILSDGFMAIISELGTLTLYGQDLNSSITTDSNASQLQISDEFAGYIDSNKTLRLFSTEGELPLVNNPVSFSLTNTFALVKDAFGLTLYGKNKSTLDTAPVYKSYAVSHENFAYVSNAGALTVKNEATDESFTVNRADVYSMSDDLLLVKNGMGDFTVYSLKSDSFGKVVHTVLDQTIDQFQVGNSIVSFQTSLASSASNSAKVIVFGENMTKSSLVDEIRVNKVNLTVNREEWNWQ